MKKTWTTRILIALMTLAMVIGVVAIAPKAAQAAETLSITPGGGAVSQTKTVGTAIDSITLTCSAPSAAPASWAWNVTGGTLPAGINVDNIDTAACNVNGTLSTAGSYSFTLTATAFDASSAILGQGTVNVSIVYTQANSSATVDVTTPFSAGKVGKSQTATFTIGGYPLAAANQISVEGADSHTYNNGTVTVYVTPATIADLRSVTVTANNGTGSASKTSTISSVAKADAAAITLSATNYNPAIGESVTLKAEGVPSNAGGTYVWTAGGVVDASVTGKTYSYTPAATGSKTFSVKWQGDENHEPSSNTPTATITTENAKVSVTVTSPSNNANVTVGSTLQLACSNNSNLSGVSFQWRASNGGTIVNSTQQSASYTVQQADINKSITFTVVASATGYTSGDSSATVNVVGDDYISSPASNYTMSFNTATLFDTQNINVTTYRNGPAMIYNSNPAVASVKVNGAEVGTSGYRIESSTTVSVKALAYGRTYIDIVPVNGTSNNGRRVTVYVGSQTPTLDVQFWSSDNCTTTLTKLYNWGTLKVTVDNYNPQYPYVTITRSNIRTYIQGGSYYSHPSTYTYTAALTQDLTDPLKATAILYVIPQYNGTTYYTAAYTGATSKNSPTIYVTGFPALPQTGPNYTWAYVLGGLCLATVATAVTLNVRKKKRESI